MRYILDQYIEEPTKEQVILDWVLCNEKGLINNHLLRAVLRRVAITVGWKVK